MSRPDTSGREDKEEEEPRKMSETSKELLKSIEDYYDEYDPNYFTLKSLDLPRKTECYGDAIHKLYKMGVVDKYREVGRGNAHTWELVGTDNVNVEQ